MLTPALGAEGGLGVLLTGGPTPGDWSAAPGGFAELDRMGASHIWIADHLFWGQPMPESLTLAAVAATTTERCRIGTGVLQLPLRRPAAVAKAATTIQELSGGRFVLGVGVGEHPSEYQLAGSNFGSRGRDLDDGMAQLRRFWSGDGEPRLRQLPVPARIPVWVGGRSAAAVRRAARTADGWMPMFQSPDQLRLGIAELAAALEVLGRDAEDVIPAVTVLVAPGEGPEARAAGLSWAADLWRADPQRLDRHLVSGTPEEINSQLDEYRRAGARSISVLLATDEPVPALRSLIETSQP